MEKKLFLLDGMALIYRAHFALMARPIFTSKGVNTSALYGFTQTLLDILGTQKPTHIAVAMDTEKPTQRHVEYAEYKATREAMPEDLALALPNVRRMLEALRIAVVAHEGYEADDVIATLVRRAHNEGFRSFMVTPDKDFGQLVNESTSIYKPGRMGDPAEILGPKEVCARWGIQQPGQVVDLLALMGDASDNIPGVPGIGEKTAAKLVSQFGTVENLLSHSEELKGKLRETVQSHREQAMLSKRLATLHLDAPCQESLDSLRVQTMNEEAVKALLAEFEFNSIGRRLFGDSFKAGRGFVGSPAAQTVPAGARATASAATETLEPDLFSSARPAVENARPLSHLDTIETVAHEYAVMTTAKQRAELAVALNLCERIGVSVIAADAEPRHTRLLGVAFSMEPHRAHFVPVASPARLNGRTAGEQGAERANVLAVLEEFRPVLENESIEKIGHDLKHVLGVLKWHGFDLRGKLFDIMIAHSLVEPDLRHGLQYLAETFLGYSPLERPKLLGNGEEKTGALVELPEARAADIASEGADLAFQLRSHLEPLLSQKGQERVFYEIESPLVPVLADMEHEGIRVEAPVLAEFASQLGKEIQEQEQAIWRIAGKEFNLNSPRQLGQILFEEMKVGEAPKKTKTGQYATDEQTLLALAGDHEIVNRLLEYRTATKLKSTYADALPAAIEPSTGRIHTTYSQVSTSTGRLNSQNPNLQNIPIRTERGQEIRKAFVPRDERHLLLSADYSQIELRIIAALGHEAGLLEAFRTGADVHTATAARVFGVFPEMVTPEMRRKAKMVNYGIAYGISSFGLAQRLGISRKEGAQIIDHYFAQFPGIRQYMDDTIAFARERGYVETVTGRRRYIRDIRSSNNTVRAAAERNAINAPVQGTAADMIKLAMIGIRREFLRRKLNSRMLLQVHDELVFDLFEPERDEVSAVVESEMKAAIPLEVPIGVEIGVGHNWLEAH